MELTRVITPINGVITLLIPGRGPLCTSFRVSFRLTSVAIQDSLRPDVISYNAAIDACCRTETGGGGNSW